MAAPVDLYGAYGRFIEPVLQAIRKETFGVDIGQNSWITVDEYNNLISGLNLPARAEQHHVLEVACGSGGPALHLSSTFGCRVTGIDSNAGAVATASKMAEEAGLAERVLFSVADANARLPFDDDSFDAIVCIDAINHFVNRLVVLREWHRVLRNGGRVIFTDPVVITGAVTNEELALRSSIGFFQFMPPGINEQFLEQAGFQLVRRDDVSEGASQIARRWHRARLVHKAELLPMEGAERFDGLQQFFEAVHILTSQRRLSRFAYLAEKDEN